MIFRQSLISSISEKQMCTMKNLDSFLALAEELQLKGLMGKSSNDEAIQTHTEVPFQQKENKIKNYKPTKSKPSSPLQDISNERVSKIGQEERTVSLTSFFSGNFPELDEKCNSMMEKTPKTNPNGLPLYRCERCGKEATNSHLKKHIEANHLEGISVDNLDISKGLLLSRFLFQGQTSFEKAHG